jgi:thioredoxin 1
MAVIEIKNQESFKKEVLQSNKPVIVDFWAEWCGPCKMMMPVFEEASRQMENFKFVKINIEDCPEIAQEYNISSIPTIIVFENGKIRNSHIGLFANQQKLQGWAESAS